MPQRLDKPHLQTARPKRERERTYPRLLHTRNSIFLQADAYGTPLLPEEDRQSKSFVRRNCRLPLFCFQELSGLCLAPKISAKSRSFQITPSPSAFRRLRQGLAKTRKC